MLRKISAEKKDVSITCTGCGENFWKSVKVAVEGEEHSFSFSLCDRCATVLAHKLLTAVLAEECEAAPEQTVAPMYPFETTEGDKIDFNELVNNILKGVQNGELKLPKGE